jgi:hypothetical protein
MAEKTLQKRQNDRFRVVFSIGMLFVATKIA